MSIRTVVKKVIKILNSKEKVPIVQRKEKDTMLMGKIALVTGGSGGIGQAIAKELVYHGAKVILAGTDEEKLAQCCIKMKSKNVKTIVLNLNDISSFSKKIEDAKKMFEGNQIDILVNSAGVNPRKGFFEISEYDYDSTMEINVKGMFFLCRTIAEDMIKNNIKGHILNISSSSALRPAWSPYEMSKWTVRGFTIGLADLLIPYGIVVNAIAPGPTATPMLGVKEGEDIDLPNSPIGRYSSPEEIASLAVLLVSDMGNLVIGDTVYATGGSGVISLHK